MSAKKKTASSHEQRRLRIQQAIFAIIAVMIILVMIISLVAR
ncbi:MAG: hypothetical protein ABFD53_12535 [Anaerolineaceae bacterium]